MALKEKRRWFLKACTGLWLGGLGLLGAYTILSFLPRPPKKILVKKKLSLGEVLVGPNYFLRLTPKGPLALSRTCPHLGCLVTYDPAEEIFICPCHQSRFTLNGRYISGPAKKDLKRLKVEHTGAGFIIEIS